jgi:hypothetical protein
MYLCFEAKLGLIPKPQIPITAFYTARITNSYRAITYCMPGTLQSIFLNYSQRQFRPLPCYVITNRVFNVFLIQFPCLQNEATSWLL